MKTNKHLIIITAIIVAAAVIGVSVAIFSANRAANDPARLLSLGEKYLLEMDYEQALVQFLEVIEIEPNNTRAYLGTAEAYVGLEQTDNAVNILRLGLERTGDEVIITKLDELTEFSKESVTDIPNATASEAPNTNESEANAESAMTENTAQDNFIVPETTITFMDDLYDALYNGDMNLVYTLATDESVRLWFGSLDHKTEFFYTAESGQVTTRTDEHFALNDFDRDRFNYSKNIEESEPHFSIEFQQSRSNLGQITMLIQYGKRENGFVYHYASIHYRNGEVTQFDWDDITYQDGKATGAFKRYMFQPRDGDIFSNYWHVQSGDTVDGRYEGDVFEERHNANWGNEEQVSTWLLKYEGGVVQPIGGADAEGMIPYAAFVGDTWGTPSQPPQTMPADAPEWGNHRPYEGIGLG